MLTATHPGCTSHKYRCDNAFCVFIVLYMEKWFLAISEETCSFFKTLLPRWTCLSALIQLKTSIW